MTSQTIITRFAPSPTGALHVGSVRTALFNWAFARQHGGQFILRIEDTDVARSTAASTRGIVADMRWLGMEWDQGPAVPADHRAGLSETYDPYQQQTGSHGPYFQSQRQAIYLEHLQRLHDAGRTYDDGGAVRFRMPKTDITIQDLVLGEVSVKAADPQMEDFIIFKSGAGGGGPTFHFANVVDDHTMKVTHVIRGQEHLNNTIKHVALQEALGFVRPAYAHIPLIFNPDGSKMSKRDKAKAARAAAKAHLENLDDPDGWLERLLDTSRYVSTLVSPPGSVITRESLDNFLTQSTARRPTKPWSPDMVRQFLNKQNDELEIAELIAIELKIDLPEINVHDFLWNGYLPEALTNYLALLGWNPGHDIEDFGASPLDFLKDHFNLNRVQRGSAKFDRDKLLEFNRRAINKLVPTDFARRIWDLPLNSVTFDNTKVFIGPDDPRLLKFTQAYQPRSRTLRDPLVEGWFFFVHRIRREDYDEKAVQKNLLRNEREGEKLLAELLDRLAASAPGEGFGQSAHDAIAKMAEEKGVKMGPIAQALRVALTGSAVSPPIDVTLEILGKDATRDRINACLAFIAH